MNEGLLPAAEPGAAAQPNPGAGDNAGADRISGRRIGVYVCHCGGNISDYVDVEKVIDDIRDAGDVVVAKHEMFACSDATQTEMVADIEGNSLDGLVVASCSPKLHTYTFRGVASRAGLNPYEYTQVNIREQCSWVHTDDPVGATAKATALVRAGISRTRNTVPLVPLVVDTIPHTLVIGGGITGLRTAVGLADIGLRVTLVEREDSLGGWVGGFGRMYPHDRDGRELIATLIAEVRKRPSINVLTGAEMVGKAGSFGNYEATIRVGGEGAGTIQVAVGSIVVATGFDSYQPEVGELGYGIEGVVTLPEFKELVDGATGPLAWHGQAGPQRRLRLLRREPRDRRLRQRVLLAVLLRRNRADRRPGVRARSGDPPVPPVPGHADVRQVRAAVHRGPQGRLRVPQVRRRRAAGRRAAG